MAYIVDPINNTLIDDEKPFKKKKYKQLEFDFNEAPTRKPGALPPGTNTIQRYNNGGKVKDMNKVVAETKKNAEFDKKYPPLVKTKALIDEGLLDQKDLVVSYDPATKLFTNKDRNIAFADYNTATKHNASIGVVRKELPTIKKFDNNDPSTYPSNQIKDISTYDLMLDSAINDPKDENSKQTIKMVKEKYKHPKSRKEMTPLERKLIAKNTKVEPLNIQVPVIDPEFYKRLIEPEPGKDPYREELQRRFEESREQNYQEKVKRNTMGLRAFAPIETKRDE